MNHLIKNFPVFLCCICCFLIFVMTCCGTANKSPEQPNILFILVDDLGYNDLSVMGSQYYETPNIDRIANEGMLFSDGYAACQVCSPSRASIMSGKFPSRHGITDWLGAKTGKDWRKAKRYTQLLPPNYTTHLPHEYTTMPEAFKAAGYKTFFAGKWHLGNEGSYPEDHGFDINQGGYEKGGPYSGGFFSPFNNPKMQDFEEEKGMSLPMKLAKETAGFIETNKDQPFFAYLAFYAVHAPIQTTKEKWAKYRKKAERQGIAESGFEMEQRMPIRKYQDNPVYAGLIEHTDDAVGHVLATLERLGLTDNTIVVFTSDNGGVVSGDNYSTNLAPLRGGKGYQWEGGIRVPYFIKVPWLEHKGAKSAIPATGTDFYPTLLDLANLPLQPHEHQDGVSLKPVLLGESIEDRSLIWHYPHYGNQGGDPSSIIRSGKWKLIHYHEDNSIELYDLNIDIGEQQNLAERHPDIVEDLSHQLQESLKSTTAKFPIHDEAYSADSFQLKYQYYEKNLMPWLEKQRKNFLSEDWQPNDTWWGSQGYE